MMSGMALPVLAGRLFLDQSGQLIHPLFVVSGKVPRDFA
jgi:hypothetical protein